ncbi:MAG TPA: LysR family transcriptional regulator [Candidatus Aquilonibacter sp.]
MDVTLAQLEALRRVARMGSFTRAAASLHVTQPAVSQQIAGLARALGVSLVETVGNRPRLTEAGAFVAERAEVVGQQVETLLRETGEYLRAERGTIDVAATLTIGNYVLPSFLASFTATRPNVLPRVAVANTRDVAAALLRGDVPLGLVEGRVDETALAIEPFMRDRLVLAVPAAGHRLSNVSRIAASELTGEPFISREVGSGTRDLGYELLVARGIAPHLVMELPSGEAIARAVEAGLGLAIVSERVLARSVALHLISVVDIEDMEMERTFWLAHVRDRILPPLASAFAAHVREVSAGAGDRR